MKRTFVTILILCFALCAFAKGPGESLQILWASLEQDMVAQSPRFNARDDFDELIERIAWLCVGTGDEAPYSSSVIALLNDIQSGVGNARVAYYVGDDAERRTLIQKLSASIGPPGKRRLTFNSADNPFASRPLRRIIDRVIAKIEARAKPGEVGRLP